ncbi:MAG: hypothetical protein CL790_05610 [Chloroflexi bacterium]|nr:hypothetical protein [Chloroflexota bacterium]
MAKQDVGPQKPSAAPQAKQDVGSQKPSDEAAARETKPDAGRPASGFNQRDRKVVLVLVAIIVALFAFGIEWTGEKLELQGGWVQDYSYNRSQREAREQEAQQNLERETACLSAGRDWIASDQICRNPTPARRGGASAWKSVADVEPIANRTLACGGSKHNLRHTQYEIP